VNRFIGYSHVTSTSYYNTFEISVNIALYVFNVRYHFTAESSQLLSMTASRIHYLHSVSRPELASSGLEIEHHVQQFIPLSFAVETKMCVTFWVTSWSIPAYFFLRKHVSSPPLPSNGLIFSHFTIPSFRRHVTIWWQRTHIQTSTYLDTISMEGFARTDITTKLAGLTFVDCGDRSNTTQSLNSLVAGRGTLQITSNYTLHTAYYDFTFVM
jgi:hypothetical protein